jgi:diacylglycerol kinase family enzyme
MDGNAQFVQERSWMTGSFPSVFFATSANWNWSGISGSISRGRRQYHPKLEMFEGQTLEVSSSKPLSVHVDGQPIGTTPVRFRVLPKALTVVAK